MWESPTITPIPAPLQRMPCLSSGPLFHWGPALSQALPGSPSPVCLKGASSTPLEACHSDPQGWTVHSLQGGGGWTGWGQCGAPLDGPFLSVTSKASPGAVTSALWSCWSWAMQPLGQTLGLEMCFLLPTQYG